MQDASISRQNTGKIVLSAMLTLAAAPRLSAEVVSVEISSRSPYANGQSFGDRGAYERLRGRVRFAVDPALKANQQIVNLELAPRNVDGRVEFSADLDLLVPADLSQANGAVLYEVNNRGNRTCLNMFNGGGDDFLMRQGYVVAWSGWIAETLPGGDRLRLTAPVATDAGQPIRGLVRAEMAPDQPADRLSIAQWANQGSYPPTETGSKQATLSWRLREKDARVVIPRAVEPRRVIRRSGWSARAIAIGRVGVGRRLSAGLHL